MANPVGSFIWYELITPDPVAAGAFYNSVVGVTFGEPMQGGMNYRLIARDDGGNLGGVLELDETMRQHGMTPRWMPYLHVEDVDAEVTAIQGEGGTPFMPPTDIPGVGRIAMVGDPQGVPIYLMKPIPPAGMEGASSDVFDQEKSQRVRWNELASPDQAASMAFYNKHFGFTFDEKMPMGDMGDYCFIDHHGVTLGAIMRKFGPEQPPLWLQYFGVGSIVEAKEKVEAAGGTVVRGPMEVPGGEWIIVGIDPQGAGFGLVGSNGD